MPKPKKSEFIIPIEGNNVTMMSLKFFLLGCLIFLLPFYLIWPMNFPKFSIPNLVIGGLILGGSMVIHEFLHGLGWVLMSDAKWKNLNFGVKQGGLVLFAHSSFPMKMSANRFAMALPGVVQGILPALAGLIIGSTGLVIYGVVMIAGAGGDFTIILKSRDIPADKYIQDHPDDLGFELIHDPEIVEELRDQVREKTKDNNPIKYIGKGLLATVVIGAMPLVGYLVGTLLGTLIGKILLLFGI